MWRTGVGFSYTTEGASFGDGVRPSLCVSVCLYVCLCVHMYRLEQVHVNDTSTAVDSERFLRRFLTDPQLFPELQNRPLFIAGESYAGTFSSQRLLCLSVCVCVCVCVCLSVCLSVCLYGAFDCPEQVSTSRPSRTKSRAATTLH